MLTRRNGGTIAALGGGTAALALLTGLAGARADSLQVNQQLLDQRIDQLAAVGLNPGVGAVFSVDQNKALGAPVVAGSFPRSILIPGTDTSFKVYGQITEVLDYWFTGGQVNGIQNTTLGNNGQVVSLPLNNAGAARARANGIFQQSPRESRIGFETRTPTPFGEARTVMEFDWAGSTTFVPGGASPTSVSDNLAPRLRYAYGTLGGFLAGQATSNFSDPDANQESLDFGGNVGDPGHVRVPQVRYTMPAWWGGALSFSAETSQTTIATANGLEGSDAGAIPTLTTSCNAAAPGSISTPASSTCTTTLLTSGTTPLNIAKATSPDFTVAYYIPQPWGHLDFSAVLIPGIDATDGRFFSKHFIGYGGHFGFDVKPGWFGWVRDDISGHFVMGDAIGSFVNQNNGFQLATNYGAPSTNTAPGTYGGFNGPTSAASAANIIFKPIQEMGANLGYQHWWTDDLRSNISGGIYTRSGIPIKLVNANGLTAGAASTGGQANTINKQLITAHVNLIWRPVSFVQIGVEYMFGQRTVLNNTTGNEQALISKIQFNF